MKKSLSILTTFSLAFLLSACNDEQAKPEEKDENEEQKVVEEEDGNPPISKEEVNENENTLDVTQYENAIFEGHDDEGFIYQVTFDFTNETEGTMDLIVIEESTSNKIEEVLGAKLIP